MKSSLEKLIKQSGAQFKWSSFVRLEDGNIDDLINEANTLFNDPLSQFSIDRTIVVDEISVPDVFICFFEQPILLRRFGGAYISASNKTFAANDLLGKEIARIVEYPKKLTGHEFVNVIYDLYPKVNFFALLTVPFVLIPAFYANLFNTRMIFNDVVYTLVFITLMFIGLWSVEYFVKYIIKKNHISKLDQNSLKVEDYLLKVIPYIPVPNIVSKVRMIESNRKVVWENISGIIVDAASIILILTIIIAILGQIALIITLFYAVVVGVAVYLRYRNYKIFIELETAQQDLLVERISYYKNNEQLRFFNQDGMASHFEHQCKNAYKTDYDLSNFNFQWDEFVRFSSFLASFILFVSIFFSAKEDSNIFNLLIALLILNSRVSGSVVGFVSKLFYLLVATYHLKRSANELFEKVDDLSFKKGIYLDELSYISLRDMSLAVEGRQILDKANSVFSKGNIYGLFGPVGSGKSTLMRAITQCHGEFNGGIVYNNLFSVTDLDRHYVSEKVSYLDSASDFVKGSIFYNFDIRGIRNKEKIAGYCKFVFPFAVIDYEFIYQKDITVIPMSVGQKRKLLLLMSLNPTKHLIILDEAFSNMPILDVAYFIKLIKDTCNQSIVFVVSHDRALLSQLSYVYEISNQQLLVNKSAVVKLNAQ